LSKVEVELKAAPFALLATSLLLSACATSRNESLAVIEPTLAASHRPPAHRARDTERRPRETLEFFGLEPDMTVVEVWPGAGWYTEILAPLLRERGRLYAAHLDPDSSEYARKTVEAFRAKLAARPDVYDKVIVTALGAPGTKNEIAPPGSADMVLTFCDLHTWMMLGWEKQAFEAMHAALKPGGVLGIVEHRADPDRPQDPKAASGYVDERYAIELIESVGFKLVGRSQVNANPKDTKNYEQGVWALPPTFAAGEAERYRAIGESDRFTLRFVKVAR
jgi:predicted methyltransferase